MKEEKIQNYSNAESKCREEIFGFLRFSLGKNFDENFIFIEYPPEASMGDFSITCFGLAKKAGVSPNEFTKSLAEQFTIQKKVTRDGRIIRDAKSFGPYLNFFVDYRRFAKNVINQIVKEKKDFGNSNIGKGQKIMIEYSQPNTHKEFHIGHLRNVCIGSSIVNFYQTLGYKVIAANYINDTGAHVSKCLWAYQKFHAHESLPENKGKFLGKIYVEANRKIEENPEYLKEVSEVAKKLESGEKKITALWKKTKKWSMEEFYAIYKRLDVHFDEYFFDSDLTDEGKKIVDELLKKGIAKKSEGAIIVDLNEYNLHVSLILKSDGTALYATKDLALAIKKFKKFKLDKSFYVVDVRQSLNFEQLFKTLELYGFTMEMKHIPYETVSRPEGTMSSRKGNVILFEDFENEMYGKVAQETKKHHPDWSEKKVSRISYNIAYAAMKYTILVHGNNTPVVFDMKKALELNGKTGPYLQYMYARISSILRKSNISVSSQVKIEQLTLPEEKTLVFHLSKFPNIIEKSALRFDPSILAGYLYELAQLFSMFYEKIPVLKAEKNIMKERLCLLRVVKVTLAKGFSLLGIEPLEQM